MMKPKISRAGDPNQSKGFDCCATPPYTLTPILPFLKREWEVWEPAAGEGLMVETLSHHVRWVYPSDILPRERIESCDGSISVLRSQLNFFDCDPDWGPWDALVTNPPYSVKCDWLARCHELGKPFALLGPVEIIGARAAQVFLKRHGFEIMLLEQRVDFKMPDAGWNTKSGAQFPVLWLTWKILPQPVMFGSFEQEKREFKRRLKESQQPSLFGEAA
jgi:hypothetical protein